MLLPEAIWTGVGPGFHCRSQALCSFSKSGFHIRESGPLWFYWCTLVHTKALLRPQESSELILVLCCLWDFSLCRYYLALFIFTDTLWKALSTTLSRCGSSLGYMFWSVSESQQCWWSGYEFSTHSQHGPSLGLRKRHRINEALPIQPIKRWQLRICFTNFELIYWRYLKR